MTRVLLAAHASVGHTNALRSIGRSLLAGGDAVAMVMPVVRLPLPGLAPQAARVAAGIPAAVRGDGIELFELGTSWAALWHGLWLSSSTGYDELGHAMGLFTAGLAGHARELASFARSWRADVVVADYLFFAAFLGARLSRTPYAAFFHSAMPFDAPGNPPFGSGLPNDAPRDDAWREAERRLKELSDVADARLAAGARQLGLDAPRAGILARPYSEDLNLLATLPELEPGLAPLDATTVFTGPCLGGRAAENPDDPALRALKPEGRRAYVSLGTVFNSNPRAFVEILRGLDVEGLQVVVSGGASTARLSKNPPSRNSHVFERVPQLAVLERVDVVVTHGGNNTVQETLAAGKPMLVVPFGGDQLENARRVERLGAGIALLPAKLSSEAVRAAVTRLLSEPGFRERATTVANAIRPVDGTARAVAAIRQLAARFASSGVEGGGR